MGVKREFGTRVSRFLQGGVKLTDAEHSIVCALVDALPPQLRSVVEAQFERYNLAQREAASQAMTPELASCARQPTDQFHESPASSCS